MNHLNIHLEDLSDEYEDMEALEMEIFADTSSDIENSPNVIDISKYPGITYILTEEGEKPLEEYEFKGNLIHPNIQPNTSSITIDRNRPEYGFKLKLNQSQLEKVDVHCNCRSFTSKSIIKRMNLNLTNENSIRLCLNVHECQELKLNLIAPKISVEIIGELNKDCIRSFDFSKVSEVKFLPIEDFMGNEIGSSRSNLLLDDPRELAKCFFTPEELKMINEYIP